MTTTLPPRQERPTGSRRLAWLGREAHAWEASGLLHEGQAEAILGSYRSTRRFAPGGLALTIGSVLLGLGLAWAVAVPLDRPVAPWLLGVWGGGGLLLAYLRRARGALVVGILATTGWWVGRTLWLDTDSLTLVLALGVAATTFLAVAAVHETRLVRFGEPWREVGAALALGMLLLASLPSTTVAGFTGTSWVVGGPLLASLAVITALAASEGSVRLEPVGALAAAVVSAMLVLWDADLPGSGAATRADWAHLGVAVTAYVALATAVGVLGIVRESRVLVALATAGVAAFALTQGAVALAPVLDAPWTFVAAGAFGLATGHLLHRALRRARPVERP